MKHSRVIILLPAILLWAGLAGSETIERIVAKVNGKIITKTELDDEVQAMLDRMGPPADGSDRAQIVEEMKRQVLKNMIDNILILQVAEDRGLRVPSRFFDDWKADVMKKMNIETEEDFVRQVEAQGATVDQVKKRFEEGLLIQEVRRTEVDSKVSVSEPEIEDRYRQNIKDYTQPAKVRLREIVVRFDESNEIEKGEKARRLLQDIRQGADFAEVARMHSESASREAGGDLGFFEQGELTDVLAQAAFSLDPGEVSDVLRLDSAFYILRVEEKTEAVTKTLEEVHSEVADAVFEEKMSGQMDRYIQQLRDQAIIEVKL
jgi:parvulin-like peptidyl-prolyl isomerase